MSRHKQRPLWLALGAILLAWALAWSGYVISRHSKMTAEKVRQYQLSTDLAKISAADRLKFLKGLAERLNALSPEERQRWRMDLDWFRQLTDDEKAFFLDAFLPGEMQIALRMFERWPKERQQQELDKAMKDLKEHAAKSGASHAANSNGTNAPLFSPELDQKVRTIGLNTLFSQGSAQTKAELAPLLMEVQRQFETGQLDMNRF